MARRRPPTGAVEEAVISDRVSIYDVSHLLPTNPRKRIELRNEHKIHRVFVHKSGGIGRGGYAGLLSSVRFVTRRKTLGGRDFPGAPYTFWIPRKPDRDDAGRLVAYRGNRDEVRSWHTGGRCNAEGVAVAIQGDPSRFPLSWQQKIALPAVLDWCRERYPLDKLAPISTHSRAKSFGAVRSKPVCPGKHAERWLSEYLARPL